MKRRLTAAFVCALFFTLALTAYILMLPKDNGATELVPSEASEYAYKESNGVETVGEGIEALSVPKSAKRGSNVSAEFKGKAGTEYQIRVYYSSGKSESKSFAPVLSDESGNFSWSWRISSNARAGNVRVIVTGEDCRVSFTMEIQ